MRFAVVRRGQLLTTALAAVLLTTASPGFAAAAAPPTTRIGVSAAPATVRVGAVVTVSGAVTPTVTGLPVMLQRLVGTRWRSLASHPVSTTGRFAFAVRATGAAATWQLRVARIAAPRAKSGASATIRVRVTATSFAVGASLASATVTAGKPVVVTGSVTPRAVGSVRLQRLQGRVWRTLALAPLAAGSTYRFSKVLPPGAHVLRVARPFTASVADGLSRSLRVTVLVPPPPVVTSALMPIGVVGARYTATLTATSGSAPYTWSASGVPPGLVVTGDGRIWGTPTKSARTTFTVTVADAAGSTAMRGLTITVQRPPAGRVWAWGSNVLGQLGDGTNKNRATPVKVSTATDVTAVASGSGDHTLALHDDGTVTAWGANKYGQLGNGTVAASPVPVPVGGLTAVTAVAGGVATSYALLADGTVAAWGLNNFGQLGLGNTTEFHAPMKIPGLTRVNAISAGFSTAYALREDGTVWSWGANDGGQAGTGSPTKSYSSPVRVTGLSRIVAVAGGFYGGLALRSDGTVWSWGINTYGSLGNATMTTSTAPVQVYGLTDATTIAASTFDGYAIVGRAVWGWGRNDSATLANATGANSDVPVRAGALAGIVAVAGGSLNGYALRNDGSVYSWGENAFGQIGNGTTGGPAIATPVFALLPRIVAIAAGGASAYAIEPVVPVV